MLCGSIQSPPKFSFWSYSKVIDVIDVVVPLYHSSMDDITWHHRSITLCTCCAYDDPICKSLFAFKWLSCWLHNIILHQLNINCRHKDRQQWCGTATRSQWGRLCKACSLARSSNTSYRKSLQSPHWLPPIRTSYLLLMTIIWRRWTFHTPRRLGHHSTSPLHCQSDTRTPLTTIGGVGDQLSWIG